MLFVLAVAVAVPVAAAAAVMDRSALEQGHDCEPTLSGEQAEDRQETHDYDCEPTLSREQTEDRQEMQHTSLGPGIQVGLPTISRGSVTQAPPAHEEQMGTND